MRESMRGSYNRFARPPQRYRTFSFQKVKDVPTGNHSALLRSRNNAPVAGVPIGGATDRTPGTARRPGQLAGGTILVNRRGPLVGEGQATLVSLTGAVGMLKARLPMGMTSPPFGPAT